ncbi:hypothetical protein ACQ4PT_003987 [Festuca glaucescens]
MAGIVGSAVVQEVVSGGFSLMRNNHEEMASQRHLIERLKWAHLELEFALERTQRMPMIEVSLLKVRMMIKLAFEESRDLLYKQQTLRANLEGGTEQGVTTLAPSLPNRIMHAVKPFFGTEKGSISGSCVRRFEMFAHKTDKFVRDVESGCSLAPYRFSYPISTQLFEDKYVRHQMVSGSQTRELSIYPCCAEDYGVVAYLMFEIKDLKTPMKCFTLDLILRLSYSTDIVGISTKCSQSLGSQFKYAAEVASGELAQISTQVGFFRPEAAQREYLLKDMTDISRLCRQEPLCCVGDGFQPCAEERFPEQVSYLGFRFFISAAEYCLQSSTIDTVKLSVGIEPHFFLKTEDGKEFCSSLSFLHLSCILKLAQLLVLFSCILEPDQTEFRRFPSMVHGRATFAVSKPTTEMGCTPKIGDGSKSRRVSKRKRVKVQTSD